MSYGVCKLAHAARLAVCRDHMILKRFESSRTISGTHRLHCFRPISTEELEVRETWTARSLKYPASRRHCEYELPEVQDRLSVVNSSTATRRTYTLSHLEMAAASAALEEGPFK